MTRMARLKAGYVALRLGAAALLSLGGATVAQAEQDIAGDVQHFAQCFGWMISDPATQVANCTPNTVAVPFGSLVTAVDGLAGWDGGPPPPPPCEPPYCGTPQ